MFDLEKAVADWRKTLMSNPSLEPGFIAEIESHLRDRIDGLVARGRTPGQAFGESIKILGDSGVIGSEFHKVYTIRRGSRPSWQAPRFVPALAWNYFRTGARAIRRNKSFSTINIVGLALGMLCFLLIMAWVRNELSFDRFHENRENLYMILSRAPEGRSWSTTTYALPPVLGAEYPEVVDFARVWPWHGSVVKKGNIRFYEETITLTDPGFFRMFTFPFVRGNPETALREKNSLVLTEDTARRYFGAEDPVGKTLYLADPGLDFQVTAVVKNVPPNSSLRFDMVTRVEWLGEDRLARWEEFVAYAYVRLRPGVSVDGFNQKISGIFQERINPDYKPKPILQPFSESYLYWAGRPGNILRVILFSSIAALILLMACVNFLNLSTIQSAQRTREVGLRKSIGAGRGQIIRQFLGESLSTSFVAMALAVGAAPLLLPAFNSLAGTNLVLFGPNMGGLILLLILTASVVGLAAGSYPAFYLSSLKLVQLLRRRFTPAAGGGVFRKILIVIQFSTSVALILCAIIVARQLRFLRAFDLGFNRDQIVTVYSNPQLSTRFDSFKEQLLGHPGVLHVTRAAQRPLDVGQVIVVDWEGNPDPDPTRIGYTMIDFDFFETFEMPIVRGRALSAAFPQDETESCIINETAAKMFGGEDPIGRMLYWSQGAIDPKLRNVRIVGVVKDFYDRSLREGIRPFIFRKYLPWLQFAFIKVDKSRISEVLPAIRETFEKFFPDHLFGYEFLDDAFNRQYRNETQQERLFNVFSLLAIVIAALGLFGLAAFTAQKKIKELGIRKVLGASVSELVILMVKEYLVWIAVANAAAWTAAFFFLRQWLNQFAQRVPLDPLVFPLASAAMLVVVLSVVGVQTVRAARANPVDALRVE